MRIFYKLLLALLATMLIIFGSLYWLMQWSFDRGMLNYVNQRDQQELQFLAKNLAEFYRLEQSWQGFRHFPHLWMEIQDISQKKQTLDSELLDDMYFSPPREPRRGHPPPPRGKRDREKGGQPGERKRPPPDHRFERPPPPEHRPESSPFNGRPTLLDEEKQSVVGRYKANFQLLAIRSLQDNSVVGWLAWPPQKKLTDSYDLAFSERQNEAFLIIVAMMFVLAVIAAVLLSRQLVGPIVRLEKATSQLTKGDFSVVLPSKGKDELAKLSRDVNELAATLQQNEESRKQWLADVSHDLRTPLAIVKGELEAIIDGIRPMNQESLHSLEEEVLHLQSLVQDLYELSNAEIGALRYQKASIDLVKLTVQAADRYRHQLETEELRLCTDIGIESAMIWGDETRLHQLFDNLLSNSLKYTDGPGLINVSLRQKRDVFILTIEDSAPAVPESALPHLFEHLFRVESSRNRQTGGSGLGLAIAKKIVDAHQGTILAKGSPLGGLAIEVSFNQYRNTE